MVNKKPESKRLASADQTETFLKDMQNFRDNALDYAFLWAMASEERAAMEVILNGINHAAHVLTGHDRFYASGPLETTIRMRRGWSR